MKIKILSKDFILDEDMLKLDTYWYRTNILFNCEKVELSVRTETNKEEELSEILTDIEREINYIQDNYVVIESGIKESDLIELKNDFWLDENEEEITPEDFINRITLVGIHIDVVNNKIDNINLEYDDGEIFLGHRISVDIKDRKIISADI